MAVKWTEKQQQVIDSRNRNLLVSAAAGSGKTAVLVERIIRMISEGDHPLDIDRLLVMTFTNAAAAEMRERIGAAVEQRLKENPKDEHLWLQAALIPQAQIMTIDSFCLTVIRNHYNTLDIDPSFRIGDEGELTLLRADVMEELLEECYGEEREEFLQFAEQFGAGRSDKAMEDVILQAWQFSQSHPWPGEWLRQCRRELEVEAGGQFEKSAWMEFLLKDAALQLEELEEQLLEALEVCRQENGPLAYEPMLMNDVTRIAGLREAAKKENFEALYRGLSGITYDRLASIRSKDIDAEKKEYVSSCRTRVKKAVEKCRESYAAQSPEEIIAGIQGTKTVIGELLTMAERFDEAYKAAKRQRNVLNFNDLEHLALEVLLEENPEKTAEGSVRRPSAAADELSRQYEEILVDEYQDSNYVQEALITSISRERYGHPNVFMVGDVKQSIYRFRLARPELFMEKYAAYSRDESSYQMIELQQNFRSRATVLEFVNDVFYQIMTKNLGGIRYTGETALYPGAVFEPAQDNARVGIPAQLLVADTGAEALKQLDDEAMDYTSRELEARLVAAQIRRLTSEKDGVLVWDKELGEHREGQYRRARYGDMVILLRSMSGWSEVFVNVLMNEGIPAQAQTRTGYFSTVEVETVLSILSVIDNPMQDIPLAAVLRSPIVGMTDGEMAWMMAAYKRYSKKNQDRGVYGAWMLWKEAWAVREAQEPEATDTDAVISIGQAEVPGDQARSLWSKLCKLEELLALLRTRARYLPIHELLYYVYRESGYYDYVSAMPAGETRRGNLDMLVEKAVAYEATSYKGLFHFVRYIEKLKKYDTDFGEASLADENGNTVRIMSVHKSKGLEFPVVFLAGLGKRFNKQDAYGQLLLDPDLGVASDWLDLELRVKAPTLKKQALKRRMELEALGEELRVLYVAMTRAKEVLIMTGTDWSLETKLEKWKALVRTEGQIPYTLLSSAGSFLDWLLMAGPAIPAAHLQVSQVPVGQLIGEEVTRQMERKLAKEDLLGLNLEHIYDEKTKEQLERVLSYQYPYTEDTGLYAMVSVSELKKQSQIGRTEAALGTESTEFEGAELDEFQKTQAASAAPSAAPSAPGRAALRGTAYHHALEHLEFHSIHSLAQTEQALLSLYETGILTQEAYEWIRPGEIWTFLNSPLGRRLAAASSEERLQKEQQFIIGIPAREMGKGKSEELVLIQGVIDAYVQEEDGLVLVDYKTDYIPSEKRSQGAGILTERYKTQLDYYGRALSQLTGKPIKERIIYSLSLQQAIWL